MKKLLISAAAVVTVSALILTGCPEDSATPTTFAYICENGTAASGAASTEDVSNCQACNQGYEAVGTPGEVGSTCTPTGAVITCVAPAGGASAAVDLVYGDATRADCNQVALAATDAFGQATDGSASLTFTEIADTNPPEGAGSSADFRRLTFTTGQPGQREGFAVAFIKLAEDYDVAAKDLKFSIRSAANDAGGNGQIRIYLEAQPPSGSAFPNYQTLQSEGTQMFTNDGAWQDISIRLATAFSGSFAATTGDASGITAANIRSIGFAILDANGLSPSGLGNQVIDIDEIRFEGADLSYICENGTATVGEDATTAGVSNCQACNQGYEAVGTLGEVGSTCSLSYSFVCTNGTAATGTTTIENRSNCTQCNAGSFADGALGTDGSACVVVSGCTAASNANNSVSTVYADGNYAACSALTLATDGFGAFSSDGTTATFSEITSGGASSTSNAYTLSTAAAATFAGGYITLAADTVVSRKTLRFSIMSPASGGTTSVRVYLEADSGANAAFPTYQSEASEGIVTFTNDGTWQDVSISFDRAYSFGQSNITSSTVRAIGFALTVDTNGDTTAGLGAQTFSVDEVRIEDDAPNCTAGTPSIIGLIWGDAVYSSCSDISNSLYTAVHVPTRNTGTTRTASPFTFVSTASAGGASSTSLSNTFTLGSGNSAWAYVIADLPANYDVTGKTLNFSIKSPATGGTSGIDVFLEGETGGPSDRTNTVNRTFTNDGTWQAISVPVSDFTTFTGVTATTVRRVVFSLVDADGLSNNGVGAQTLDIDEIRFE